MNTKYYNIVGIKMILTIRGTFTVVYRLFSNLRLIAQAAL